MASVRHISLLQPENLHTTFQTQLLLFGLGRSFQAIDRGKILALAVPALQALSGCAETSQCLSSANWPYQQMLQQALRGTASAPSITKHVTTVLTLTIQHEEAACSCLMECHGAYNSVCCPKAEEAIWTDVIQKYQSSNANWMPDVVGRAYGNRGNARSRQGKMQEALSDFNQSMQLCPWSGEPVLNR